MAYLEVLFYHSSGMKKFYHHMDPFTLPLTVQLLSIVSVYVGNLIRESYHIFFQPLYVNHELPDVGFRKAEEPEFKLPTSVGSSKKQESSRKTSTSALLTMPKPLTVWITTNCGKFWKSWEYQTTWPASWEICMQIRKKQWEVDMGQQTCSK